MLYKDFEMKFQIYSALNGRVSNSWNVLHLTTNGDNGNYGSRIPAIYLTRLNYNSSYDTHNEMQIFFSMNGVSRFQKNFAIPQSLWVDVQLKQRKVSYEYVFEYRVGNQTVTMRNNNPADFKTVLAYASLHTTLASSWYGSIKVRDFEVCTTGNGV